MLRKHQQDELKLRMDAHRKMHPSLKQTYKVPYGTAGFRGPVKEISWIFYRAGIMAALKCFDARQAIGVMITASHNPIGDNGLKFIDKNGLMLSTTWELIMDELCNIYDIDEFIAAMRGVIDKHKIYCDVKPTRAQVFFGYDTRPESEYLKNIAVEGVRALGLGLIPTTDFKLCTTPELHWLVAEANKRDPNRMPEIPQRKYWETLVAATKMGLNLEKTIPLKNYDRNLLVVDCSNGVGAKILEKMKKFLRFELPMELINTGEGVLNESCGADYVKSNLKPPIGADKSEKRYASLDGDADRLVYFYMHKDANGSESFRLLDGDRIQALFAIFVTHIISESRYNGKLSIGCIQTAYANGASTDFLKGLGLPVDCVDTGVKNLQRRALKYDIGIYFESNGHGTIHLSKRADNVFTCHVKEVGGTHDPTWQPTTEDYKANFIFKVLSAVVNVYTGDGIADILLVEVILRHLDWSMDQWYALYEDRPNRLIKLTVKDKSVIRTVDAGRRCCAPQGLQAEINAIVAGFGPHARCFVRASGTENVVRIYAEADKQAAADEIANLVGRKTLEICNKVAKK